MNGCYLNQENVKNRKRQSSFQYYTKKKDFIGCTDEIKYFPFSFGKHMESNYLTEIMEFNKYLGVIWEKIFRCHTKKEWRPLLVKKHASYNTQGGLCITFSRKRGLEDPDEGIYVFSVEAGERQTQRILYHEGEV